MSDSDEYEEEECLVFADFENQLIAQDIGNSKLAIKLIGFETQTPMAEINGHIFKGNYDYAIGSNVFFAKDVDAKPSDPLFEAKCKQKYKYFAKTNKVINFERIFVESTKEPSVKAEADVSSNNEIVPEEERLEITMTYEEAIKQIPPVATEAQCSRTT